MCEKKESSAIKSSVISLVRNSILWASEPLQSSANAHLLGQKCGQQSGDLLYANLNWYMSIITSYVAGQSIVTVQENCQDFISKMQRPQFTPRGGAILLHSQCLVLKEGVAVLDAEAVDNIPTERDFLISAEFGKHKVLVLTYKIHQLVRAFLFRQLDDFLLDTVNIWDTMSEEKHHLRPLPLLGIFFEGLVCFQLARQSNDDERSKWIKKGEMVLEKIQILSQHSSWNWENKMLLLEAEKMHTLGGFDSAASFYERSIRSAREHKFIHEEAIASELAGLFFLERGLREKSLHLFLHSIWSYKTWGALAVAKRVETFIVGKFGSVVMQMVPSQDTFDCLFESSGDDASKKRQARD